MTSRPPISVVTPSYNQADFLNQTLQSVLAPDNAGVEYLVIDGASTDRSVEIIRAHAPRLAYWVSEPDTGQAAAINKGLRRAQGELLAWLNSDDTYRPGAIAAVVSYMTAHPEVDVVYGDIEFVGPDGLSLGSMPTWDFNPQQQICATNLIPQPATFFRRALFERVGGLDESLHFALDYDLWVRMLLAGGRFAHVPQVWATFRLHPTSKTQGQALQFVGDMRRVLDKAFAGGQVPARWRPLADSNLEQFAAETYLRSGQPHIARRHYLRAIRRYPWRLKTLSLLAFALDTRLGLMLRRWRWRLAGRTETPWRGLPPA